MRKNGIGSVVSLKRSKDRDGVFCNVSHHFILANGRRLFMRNPAHWSVIIPILVALFILASGLHAQTSIPKATIEAKASGIPINPLLYGQFIEHLDHCIQQGVWAEMLMDRKFLLPPGKYWNIYNPQSVTGEVKLDPAGAYAGDHCMAIWLQKGDAPYGIHQDDIGLVKGRKYVGYAILADIQSPSNVKMSVKWGDSEENEYTITLNSVGSQYRKYGFSFTAGATTNNASIYVTVDHPTYLWIGCLSLMPADNVDGMRADTLKLIKELDPPVMRWPGGNFVSGYDWRDGIGPRDRRPPRWDRAWNNVEDNDFGADEFMDFCRRVGCQPYVAVNTGLGNVRNAADEVEYFTGSVKTKWGAVRARNGHPAPYSVSWWGIGNEMFGDWQLGHVPVQQYALRNNEYVREMRRVDPNIRVIVVGAPGGWNDVIFPECSGYMDLISGHFYAAPSNPANSAEYESRFIPYSDEVAEGIRGIVNDFKPRLADAAPDAKKVRLAIDEWGLGGNGRYFCLGDAIAVARGMNELLRSAGYVTMANWAQTVNVLGAINTTKNYASMNPIGYVLELYRKHMEGNFIPMTWSGSPLVDGVAARNPKTGAINVALVNYSPDSQQTVAIHVDGMSAEANVTAWRIDGPTLEAVNIPGAPNEVNPMRIQSPLRLDDLKLPAHSVTILEIR
jgi:alpha-N-arabinofuranosidase